jgi:hypothetical protein
LGAEDDDDAEDADDGEAVCCVFLRFVDDADDVESRRVRFRFVDGMTSVKVQFMPVKKRLYKPHHNLQVRGEWNYTEHNLKKNN